MPKNWKFGCWSWKTKIRTEGSLSRKFFFRWVRKGYQDDGKIWTPKWRPASGKKKKWNVPFVSLEQINEELDRLTKIGVLSKLEYSELAAPTVYVKKKSKEICISVDFSAGLNAALKFCHYPLLCPEDIFAKLNVEKFFLKIDLSDAYLQILVEEEFKAIVYKYAPQII